MNISAITYNTWIKPNDFRQRMMMFSKVLKAHNPDFIALQELVSTSFNYIKQEFSDYYQSKASLEGRRYGELILSKHVITARRTYPFQSRTERQLHSITVEIKNTEITVATMHLESRERGQDLRKKQYKQMFELLSVHDNVILMGDTNIYSTEEDDYQIPQGWKDAWVELGSPQKYRYTFDASINGYIPTGSNWQSRLDRVFYKSDTLQPLSMTILGTKNINGVFPSDHFGVMQTFKFT